MNTIEKVVDVLHERLVRWGWILPNGTSLPWEYWCRGNQWSPRR
jgi:hypothetical protein